MNLQLKILLGMKALPIPNKNWKNLFGVVSNPPGVRRVTTLAAEIINFVSKFNTLTLNKWTNLTCRKESSSMNMFSICANNLLI